MASGVVNTFHELGGAIGVAVVSTVAAGSISAASTAIAGYHAAFTVCAAVAAGAGLTVLALVPAGKPQAVVGHGH